jgi:uncharacterized protein (DUF58 family)
VSSSHLVLTPRGRGMLVGVFVVLLLAFYAANLLLFVVAVFLAVLVLAALVSFARATIGFGPEAFRLERIECSSFVRVGGSALVTVRVTSRLARNFYAELYDRHPERLLLLEGSPRLATWWTAGETLTLAYVVSPKTRGLFEVGPTVVVAHDPLGFAYKTVALLSTWSVETIPRPAALPLGHPARIWNMIVGQAALSARGSGSDFHALREYQPGDEPRHIAWTRSGKGTLYSREYDRESQQDLVVVLDVGRSMAMGPAGEEALEKAVEAAAQVLSASFDEDGRSGLVIFGDQPTTFVPAGRGSDHEFRVFRALAGAEVDPRPSSAPPTLERLVSLLARPTNLVVFSTLEGDPTRIAAACGNLRRGGHRLYVLVPDAAAMYPDLPDALRRDALGLLLETEVRRARGVAQSLEAAGVTVGFFGREGAIAQVAALYAQRSIRSVVG